MAEAEENFDDEENENEEADELERLLDSVHDDGEEGGEGEEDESEKSGRFALNKKTLILVGGGIVLILLLAGGAYFFLGSSTQSDEVDSETQAEQQEGEEPSTPLPVETVKSTYDKVNIFILEPFFLPLKLNEKETGKFISVTPNLVLSNSTLSGEIKNSLPAIRRNIYNILSRKNPQEFFSSKVKIEERIKKEILTTVNPILLAGTGSVTDVVFTQFVIK